jgi:3'-5' exoribonuclease
MKTDKDIFDKFEYFISLIENPKLQRVCDSLRNYNKFWYWLASIGHHHSFKKGLIIHTLEVTEYAVHISKLYDECDLDVLITASLWHDLAKIWDYNWNENEGKSAFYIPKFEKSDYYDKIHHISGSTAEFTYHARVQSVDQDIIQKIQHCILSHHGTKEYGSIKVPASLEAIILHQADMLSAIYPKYKEFN